MHGPTAVVQMWTTDLVFNRFVASPLLPRPLRWRLLAALGMDVRHSAISAKVHFGGRRISIGKGSFLNYGVFLDNTAAIRIGSRTQLGPQVMVLTGTHEIGDAAARAGSPSSAPVTIGNGVWIGARATVLPGVTIGDGCIVAAGAVVTQDCEPQHVYAGVPARKGRRLD